MSTGRFRSLLPGLLIVAVPLAAYCAIPTGGPEKGDTISSAHTVNREKYFPQLVERGDRCEIRMTVGTIDERHDALKVDSRESAVASFGAFHKGDFLSLRFVIPDDLEGHRYDFRVLLDSKPIQVRSGGTRGFGARTVFIPLPNPSRAGSRSLHSGAHSVVVENHANEPLYLESLTLIPHFENWLNRPFPQNDFTLALLVGEKNPPDRLRRMARLIDVPTVRKAISSEIYYMCRSDEQIAAIAKSTRDVCEKYGLAFLPATCSWWAGTPPIVRKRIDFQQICWSDSDTYDEGEPLKNLLGDKWDIHYGLTVPNKWSNTPWQTMNSTELNRMRAERMQRAMTILEKELPNRLVGTISENEPAYWAFEDSDEKYPVCRHPLWADFNPSTVADARRDGVVLDPSDGLDLVERLWLLYNVARYNQFDIDALRSEKPTAPLYTHALLDYNHFPLYGTGHARPYAEAARVRGARLGVEMIWGTDMDALWRIREWGRWGCVNREEYDGWGIAYHIATLRACYMMGADLLNSYNWNQMGREGDPVTYFNTFLREVATNQPLVVSKRSGGDQWHRLTEWNGPVEKNDAFPWFDTIELGLRCGTTSGSLVAWITGDENSAIVAWRRIEEKDVAKAGDTEIDFGDLAQLRQKEGTTLHLRASGEWWVRGSDAGPEYRLLCDLHRERRRSQFVLNPSARPDTVSLSLSRKRPRPE